MEPTNEHARPDISGVSQEIQHAIRKDMQAPSSGKGYNTLLSGKQIGISVSDNEELEELGYSSIHLKDLMIEMARHILINGGTIVYGGNINKEGYTYLFSDLAFQYRDKKESRNMQVMNYFAFPIYKLLAEEDEIIFKKNRTGIIKVPPPADILVDREKYLPPDTVDAKVIWARSLTETRCTMIGNTDARILVGGKMCNYAGKMPGIIEEARITLEQKKPLYLIGALGGACKEIINALHGQTFTFTHDPFYSSEKYLAFKDLYNQQGKDIINPDNDAKFFKEAGIQQLSDINGLTPEENERLFITTNLPEMLYYIFKGLKKCLQ